MRKREPTQSRFPFRYTLLQLEIIFSANTSAAVPAVHRHPSDRSGQNRSLRCAADPPAVPILAGKSRRALVLPSSDNHDCHVVVFSIKSNMLICAVS